MKYAVVSTTTNAGKVVAIFDKHFTVKDLNDMLQKEFPDVDKGDIVVAQADTCTYVSKKTA